MLKRHMPRFYRRMALINRGGPATVYGFVNLETRLFYKGLVFTANSVIKFDSGGPQFTRRTDALALLRSWRKLPIKPTGEPFAILRIQPDRWME